MTRFLAPILLLAACSVNPDAPSVSLFPNAQGFGNLANAEHRGAVEVYVKTHFDTILAQIRRGDGPELTEAYRIAGVPESDRLIRTLQLRGDIALYESSASALVGAILLYGG